MTCERCLCSRCHPTDARAQCSSCGQEIRKGRRDGQEAWWHRENVDHAPIHGHRLTHAAQAEQARQEREVVRYYDDGEPYTTAEHDIRRDKDVDRRKRRLAELHGEDVDYREPIPEPEVRRHDVDPESFPPRSGIRQVINLITKTGGWELRRLTAARGPYIGSDGSVLSISDTVVIGAVGPEVDGGRAVAVGSWRDGKFDTAYTGRLVGRTAKVDAVNATELKSWIKETA